MLLPHYPVVAYGDHHRLQQVMINLLANARTHTPPGTQVHTEVSVTGPEEVITVTDYGPGITPEETGRLFTRFACSDASRKRTPVSGQCVGTSLAPHDVAAWRAC